MKQTRDASGLAKPGGHAWPSAFSISTLAPDAGFTSVRQLSEGLLDMFSISC